MTRHHVIALAGLLCVATGHLPAAAQVLEKVVSADDAAVRLGEESQSACTDKLKRIWTAIDRYRQTHGEFPEWLSDLQREGLVTDSALLICPVTLETGRVPELTLYFPDPHVPGSYLYEFCPATIGPGAEPGELLTMRSWKKHQQELVGGRVPLVRCVMHGAVLNIGVEGDFFEGDLAWETGTEDPEVQRKLAPGGGENPGLTQRQVDAKWIGVEAPSVSLELLGGGWIDPGDRDGEIIVLEFWATWCRPCVRALPHFQELAEEYAEQDVVFVAVNVQELPDRVQRFLKQRELELTVALDRDRRAANFYGTQGVPRTVVIGKDGRVSAVHNGSQDYARVMRGHLDAALK